MFESPAFPLLYHGDFATSRSSPRRRIGEVRSGDLPGSFPAARWGDRVFTGKPVKGISGCFSTGAETEPTHPGRGIVAAWSSPPLKYHVRSAAGIYIGRDLQESRDHLRWVRRQVHLKPRCNLTTPLRGLLLFPKRTKRVLLEGPGCESD